MQNAMVRWLVGTAAVNSHGNAFFRAVVAGRTYFQGQFAGNAVYSPARATRIVQVYGKMVEIFGGAYRTSGGVRSSCCRRRRARSADRRTAARAPTRRG